MTSAKRKSEAGLTSMDDNADSSHSKRTTDIESWSANAEPAATEAPEGITSRLYRGCVNLFKAILKESSAHERITSDDRCRLENCYSAIVLWADGYGMNDGRLDELMAKSRSLRQLTWRALSRISRGLLDGKSISPCRQRYC